MLNFTKQLEAPFSQKEKSFFRFFISFLKCALNLEYFEKKKMSILEELFPKLLTPKEVVT